jgi:hypothetical protein
MVDAEFLRTIAIEKNEKESPGAKAKALEQEIERKRQFQITQSLILDKVLKYWESACKQAAALGKFSCSMNIDWSELNHLQIKYLKTFFSEKGIRITFEKKWNEGNSNDIDGGPTFCGEYSYWIELAW